MPSPQLSTRTIDIPSHLSSDRYVDPALFQLILKRLHRTAFRLHVIAFFDRIHWYQIYVTVQAFDQSDQLSGILVRIIYAFHQTVFKGDPSACLLEIIRADLDQFLQGITVCDRHKLPSLLIGRRVQRKRQRDLQVFVGKLPHPWHNAACRHRNIPLADM